MPPVLHPVVLFVLFAFGVFGLLTAHAIRQVIHGDPANPGAWRKPSFAVLLWILVTVAASIPMTVHTMLMAHSDPRANPWTAAPILLAALPLYLGVGIWLCRWAARERRQTDLSQ